MKLKTLAIIQLILGIVFLSDGLWGTFSTSGYLPNFAQNFITLGFGLFALLTGIYNLKKSK